MQVLRLPETWLSLLYQLQLGTECGLAQFARFGNELTPKSRRMPSASRRQHRVAELWRKPATHLRPCLSWQGQTRGCSEAHCPQRLVEALTELFQSHDHNGPSAPRRQML